MRRTQCQSSLKWNFCFISESVIDVLTYPIQHWNSITRKVKEREASTGIGIYFMLFFVATPQASKFLFSPEALIIWFCALNMFQNQIHHNFVFGRNNFISVGTLFLPLEIGYIYLVSSSISFNRLHTKHHEWRLPNCFSGKSQWFNNVMWFTLLSWNTTHFFRLFTRRHDLSTKLFVKNFSRVKTLLNFFSNFSRFDNIATFFFFSIFSSFQRKLSLQYPCVWYL